MNLDECESCRILRMLESLKKYGRNLDEICYTCFDLKPFVTNRTPPEGVPTSPLRLRSNSELPCSLGALTTEETKGDGFRPSSEARAFGTRGGQQTCLRGDSC